MTDAETLLIFDVDTGIDDALGLLLACAAPAATILGVSTVAGNVDLQRATRNTRAVLALAGRSDIPVWPGCVRPLVREAADASLIHGGSGLGHAVLPEPDAPEAADNAIDAVVAAARKYPGQVVLVATGPLTNIAVALMREPELPKYLKRLVLMGGAYREAATPRQRRNSTSGTIPTRRASCSGASEARDRRRWWRSGSTSRARRFSCPNISTNSPVVAPTHPVGRRCCVFSRIRRVTISNSSRSG
jgi:hypothetical protein